MVFEKFTLHISSFTKGITKCQKSLHEGRSQQVPCLHLIVSVHLEHTFKFRVFELHSLELGKHSEQTISKKTSIFSYDRSTFEWLLEPDMKDFPFKYRVVIFPSFRREFGLAHLHSHSFVFTHHSI